ncbi:uncharacterized protein LOC125807240 [Solanum verrucosum]|uniref:uncharacterized protein LOC125807240 n=1 Tax=Solanum verrucosum TaxID=315347 RepID=UPI0020D1058E|nr:uncharacterized protein LOC125807240 [Solanum verrucosum]
MRARTNSTFSEFLLRVSNGDEPTIRDNLILLHEQLTVKHSRDGFPEESIIQEIFPNMQENASTAKYVTERAILASRNDHVDKLNDKLIAMFPGESKIFNSFDLAEDDTNNYYQEEYLYTLTPIGLPPHRLELKENAPIMLLRNLDPSSGLCNGTRMICRGFSQNVMQAEISSGHFATNYVFLPRIQLSPPENEGYAFKFIRKQFPLSCPYLEELYIRYLASISDLCSHQLPTDYFNKLQTLKVMSCGELRNLMSPSVASGVRNLRILEIGRCPSMEEVITEEKQQGQETKPLFPLLEKLKLYSLPKLRHFFVTKCALEFPCLIEVRIGECPEMKTFIQQGIMCEYTESQKCELGL